MSYRYERVRDPHQTRNTFCIMFIIIGASFIAGICQKIGNMMEENIKKNYTNKCSYICSVEDQDSDLTLLFTQCVFRCLKTFYKK